MIELKLKSNFFIKITILFIFFVNLNFAFSQSLYTSNQRRIQLPLWADLDAYPSSQEAANLESGVYDFAISRLKELAPFLIEGMVYGWSFRYVPSDKMRQVEEIIEVEPLVDFSKMKSQIVYRSPFIENSRLNCWCEFSRNESQQIEYELWSSIENPVIHGTGYGELSEGFDGIQKASYDAVKNAVREYYRNMIKNKPKEISGEILIKTIPMLGVKSGRYMLNLDFFLKNGKIIQYTQY